MLNLVPKKITNYPDSNDIYKMVIARPENKVCFDCGAPDPNCVDVWYGVFICLDCALYHRDNFDNHTCLPCPTSLYNTISFMLIRMNIGGNKRARDFFHRHGWTDEGTVDLVAKYNSPAANLYRPILSREVFNVTHRMEASVYCASDLASLESDDENPLLEFYPDADAIFEKVTAKPENKVCFDCGEPDPICVNVWYGVFICVDCALYHHDNCHHDYACLPRPTCLYNELPFMLILMNVGGNERARDFFHQFGWTNEGTEDRLAKYNSLIARLYRSRLIRDAFNLRMKASLSHASHLTSELPDVNVTQDFKERTLEDQNPETSAAISTAYRGEQKMIDQVTIQASHAFSTADLCGRDKIDQVTIQASHAFSTADLCGRDMIDEATIQTSPAISTADLCGQDTIDQVTIQTSHAISTADLCGRDMIDEVTIQETYEARTRFPNAKSISSAKFFRDQVETDDTEAKHRLEKFANATAISSADLFECSANVGLCKRGFCSQHKKQVQECPELLEEFIEAYKKMSSYATRVTRFFGGV